MKEAEVPVIERSIGDVKIQTLWWLDSQIGLRIGEATALRRSWIELARKAKSR